MEIRPPAAGEIGAEFSALDVRQLTPEQARLILDHVYRHKLVVFRGQTLTRAEYIDFARLLGRPQVYFQPNYHHPEHPEIFVSSNVPENGRKIGVAGTGRYWHTDYQFFLEPLPLTLLYPQVLPLTKRETYYIDMERVCAALPEELRRLVEGRRAVQDAKWRYKVTPEDIDRALIDLLNEAERQAPPITHPAIIQHPVTGGRILYMSSGFTAGIEGLTYEENRAALAALFDFVERPEHVHTHPWEHGDILLWDNRGLIHKAGDTPKGEPSASYRIGIYDEVPFYTNPSSPNYS